MSEWSGVVKMAPNFNAKLIHGAGGKQPGIFRTGGDRDSILLLRKGERRAN